MIEYVSTRDTAYESSAYTDGLLQGLAPDGGLYRPKEYPQLTHAHLEWLSELDYVGQYLYVKGLFVGDSISQEAQASIAHDAFNPNSFLDKPSGEITPVQYLADGLFIQQLSEGPTAAFKDMALQPVSREMHHELTLRGEVLTILGATSGDTGSAAESAVKGLGTIGLFMLSPQHGSMTKFQRAQMGVLSGGNITNISIDGDFDACQDLVKAIKLDPEFAQLGAVNSINWGRIASQVPYYVSGYLQAVKGEIGKPVDFVVPSGNFGNVLAGYIAREMGLPIRRLIVATNENDVLHRVVQTGKYVKIGEKALDTSSPSMDITKASNFERLVHDIFGQDAERTAGFMQQFTETGSVAFADFGINNDVLKHMNFDSGSSSAHDRIESIKWASQNGMIIDPHTADAVTVARKLKDEEVPLICMATAKPVKFEDTIKQAIGYVP